jgi:hypothetical protein
MIDVNDWPLPDKEKLFGYLGTNSYRSERYKLFYVATPKVACTSLKWWFADLEGYTQVLREITDSAETDPDLVIHDSFHKVAPNVAGLYPEALLEPLTSDAYFRFAVVRNPYKRIFSAWQSKLLLREPLQVAPYLNCGFYNQRIEKGSDIATAFEGFLEHLAANEAPDFWDVHWTPQASLLRPDLVHYSKLVKIENAKELSTALSEWLGPRFVDPFATRRTNESLIPYLPEFVTERSAELIRSLYAEDFEAFGYDKQPPEAKETFSADQFNLAFKAIALIRGRHQRLGERNGRVISLTQVIADRAQSIAALQVQVQELLTGNAWLSSQREAWEKAAADREQSIAALQVQVQELLTGNAWLTSQREAWEKAAADREQSIAALQVQVQELLTGNAWLSSQHAAWESASVLSDAKIKHLDERLKASDAVLNRIRSHRGMKLINYFSRTKLF